MKRQKQPWPDHLADYLVTEITARDESVKKPKLPKKRGGCLPVLIVLALILIAILGVYVNDGYK